MAEIVSQEISGSGVEYFGDIQVGYLFVDVLTVGPNPRPLEVADPDHMLRIGWLSFGNIQDEFGEPRQYWRAPIWIDFTHFFWTPVPQYLQSTGPDLIIWAHNIRWSLSPGVTAYLSVHSI